MNDLQLSLYLEINSSSYIYYVSESDDQNNFKIIYETEIPLEGINKNGISDLEKVLNIIKKNIYIIEQKFDYTFKDIILILDNFNPTFINISGFKKLNGTQVLKENIIYILNTLKSCVNEIETKKNILHIFNSKFNLDNKNIENLPIGLFGDFYSHELCFSLINKNEYKNLQKIFNNCNLKIKKMLIKSFIKGASISENNKDTETFFHINIGKSNSKIFFFENNSLKLEQNYEFGSDIILKDISKITSLKIDMVKDILNKIELKNDMSSEDLIEENLFKGSVYRKIKKKLLYEIALARIKEIFEIILFKNINFKSYNKKTNKIFLELDCKTQLRSFKELYKTIILEKGSSKLNFTETQPSEKMLEAANRLVHFGWKKEAIPVSHSQKSVIARFFDRIFS